MAAADHVIITLMDSACKAHTLRIKRTVPLGVYLHPHYSQTGLTSQDIRFVNDNGDLDSPASVHEDDTCEHLSIKNNDFIWMEYRQ